MNTEIEPELPYMDIEFTHKVKAISELKGLCTSIKESLYKTERLHHEAHHTHGLFGLFQIFLFFGSGTLITLSSINMWDGWLWNALNNIYNNNHHGIALTLAVGGMLINFVGGMGLTVLSVMASEKLCFMLPFMKRRKSRLMAQKEAILKTVHHEKAQVAQFFNTDIKEKIQHYLKIHRPELGHADAVKYDNLYERMSKMWLEGNYHGSVEILNDIFTIIRTQLHSSEMNDIEQKIKALL